MSKSLRLMSFVLMSAVLSACNGDTGGGSGNTGDSVTVEVVDNGQIFAYQTTSNFQPSSMSKTDLQPIEAQMFDALNEERSKGGTCTDIATGKSVYNPPVSALKLEPHIYAAATEHAGAMVKLAFDGHLNDFDAANRTPARRMVNAGYRPKAPGKGSGKALFFEESLAYGFMTPAEVLNAWKEESFDHCMTIYVDLTYGAVAVKDGEPGSKYERYWVFNVSGDMPVQ